MSDGASWNGQGLQLKPASIVYTAWCCEAGVEFEQLAGAQKRGIKRRDWSPLKWTTWTTGVATGSGYDWNDNNPADYPGGKFTAYPVTIRLYSPEYVHGYEVFKQMSLHYTGKPPDPPFFMHGPYLGMSVGVGGD